LKADTAVALYSNYATMAAAAVKNSDAVIKYGNIGKVNDNEGWQSLMYMAEVYGKEKVDSVKWLEVVTEGVDRFPTKDYFVANLMDYYLNSGKTDEALAKIDQLLTVSETPYYLYVKGILLAEKKQYEDAMVVLDKIIEKNSDLVAEAYSKKGECYIIPAQSIVEENSSLNLDDPKYNANEEKIKDLYEKAKPLFEKARDLKPDNKQLWGNALLAIYWKLNKSEYESLAREMGIEL
jgi:tetratricopeptide (TPR) repeat protein